MFQHADDAVGVSHRRHLRSGHHYGLLGPGHCILEALLYACRAVDNDEVERAFQFVGYRLHALRSHCRLVPGLGRRQQREVLDVLVTYQGFVRVHHAVHNIDQVMEYPAFQAEHQVQVAKADVRVDQRNTGAHHGKRCPDTGSCSRLSHSAFTGGHYNYTSAHTPNTVP